MDTPIADFVGAYADASTVRLHMPGHKGRPVLGCEAWDITEVHGADSLYEAQGIIAQSEANASQLFGTAQTFYSTEGSSQVIRAMITMVACSKKDGRRPWFLAARNAHKAFLYALALVDADVIEDEAPTKVENFFTSVLKTVNRTVNKVFEML